MSRTLHHFTGPLYVQDVNIQYKDGQTTAYSNLGTLWSNFTSLLILCGIYNEGVAMLLSVFADEKITNDFQKTPANMAKF